MTVRNLQPTQAASGDEAMTLALVTERPSAEEGEEALDRVFFALSDPVRRAILSRLDQGPALVSELAGPFDMSLQAVSRHIQVLVRAGLVAQERTGRIARCNLDAAPLYGAAVWLNRYARYWQQSFDTLAELVKALPPKKRAPGSKSASKSGPGSGSGSGSGSKPRSRTESGTASGTAGGGADRKDRRRAR